MNNLKDRITSLMQKQGMTIQSVGRLLGYTSGNTLHDKLRRDSLRYQDVERILEILGYEIKWHRRK